MSSTGTTATHTAASSEKIKFIKEEIALTYRIVQNLDFFVGSLADGGSMLGLSAGNSESDDFSGGLFVSDSSLDVSFDGSVDSFLSPFLKNLLTDLRNDLKTGTCLSSPQSLCSKGHSVEI